jgi:hypothetical protein
MDTEGLLDHPNGREAFFGYIEKNPNLKKDNLPYRLAKMYALTLEHSNDPHRLSTELKKIKNDYPRPEHLYEFNADDADDFKKKLDALQADLKYEIGGSEEMEEFKEKLIADSNSMNG